MEKMSEESVSVLSQGIQKVGIVCSDGGCVLPQKTAGKVITCRAAVAWGPKQPLVIEEVHVDPPQAMEVRIKIIHASLCHTDLSVWKGCGDELFDAFPRIFGHEGAGIVESVGEGVTDIMEGDHVIPLYNGECGDCIYCKSTKTNQCERFKTDATRKVMRNDGKTRFSIKGKPVYHFMATSTFTEYTVVDYACVVKINPEAPLDKACLLGCGVTTGLGAVFNTANVEPGSTVAIFGLGTVGLAVIGEMTNGGVDYSFECIGNTEVLYQAFLATSAPLGLTVIVGADFSPRKLSLHPLELFTGRRLVTTIFGGVKGKSELPGLVDKCMSKEIRVEEFITNELPFSEINKAFDLLLDGKSLRCILHL